MRLFHTVEYRLTRADSVGTITSRVFAALRTHGLHQTPLSFSFSDSPFSKVSGVDRILKRFPSVRANGDCSERVEDQGVSSVVASRVPLPTLESPLADEIEEVMQGVPRRFPVDEATITFKNIAWDDGMNRENPTLPDDRDESVEYGGIRIQSSWWISGRDNHMLASVELPVPSDDSTTFPAIPEPAATILPSLGPIQISRPEVFFDDEEQQLIDRRKQEADEVIDSWRGRFKDLSEMLLFPHRLPHPSDAENHFAPHRSAVTLAQ